MQPAPTYHHTLFFSNRLRQMHYEHKRGDIGERGFHAKLLDDPKICIAPVLKVNPSDRAALIYQSRLEELGS